MCARSLPVTHFGPAVTSTMANPRADGSNRNGGNSNNSSSNKLSSSSGDESVEEEEEEDESSSSEEEEEEEGAKHEEEEEEQVAPLAPVVPAAPAPVAPPPQPRVHFALITRNLVMLQTLLAQGIDANMTNHKGVTPLHVAATNGCASAAAVLLKAGANTELLTHAGYSPLHLAIAFNRESIVKLLLKAPTSCIELCDQEYGLTPLSWAARLPLPTMLRLLLAEGANVRFTSPTGSTPLHWACRWNFAENVEILLTAGADPGTMDETGADAGSVVRQCDTLNPPGNQGAPIMEHVANEPSAMRIWSALIKAKAWRRRGWLMVLVERRAVAMPPGATPKKSALGSVPTTYLSISPVDTPGNKRPKETQAIQPLAPPPPLSPSSECDSEGQGVIDLLVRLRASEKGLFRGVVNFI